MDEFVYLKIKDVHFASDPLQVRITHGRGQSSSYVRL
jgi:hypothetical protein